MRQSRSGPSASADAAAPSLPPVGKDGAPPVTKAPSLGGDVSRSAPNMGEAGAGIKLLAGADTRTVSTGLKERLRERRQAKRRRKFFTVATIAVLAVLLSASIWLIYFSPYLALNAAHIKVIGAKDHAGAITRIVSAQVGVPLARLPLAQMEKQILTNPWIASAQVKRSWPTGINISVSLRQAVAVAQSGSAWNLLASDATVLGRSTQRPSGLPQVNLQIPDSSLAKDSLVAALKVTKALPAGRLAQVSKVSVSAPDAIELDLNTGRKIKWGGTGDLELKLKVWAVFESQPGSIIDLSDPGHPSIR